ncbi:MAG TPA: hypothetical protein VM889_14785 [Candidatus Thermoplasmatota archaeon]|nr:hypothetical protein [Candidatus Thermoplasmatota archaeon]
MMLAASGIALAGRGDDDDGKDGLERKPEKPRFGKHGDKFLLRNENISVWFHAAKNHAKPQLKVFHTDADGNKTGYFVDIERVIEVDADASKGERVVRSLKLSRADDWNVRTIDGPDTLTVTMVRAEGQAIVKLVFHISKSAPSVKFDLEVENWRWAENAANHSLALVMLVHEKELKLRDGRSVEVTGGLITWDPEAKATYADGSSANLTVRRIQAPATDEGDEDEDDDRERAARGKQRIVLLFEGAPGGYEGLVYDPTFTVASTATKPVPIVGPALVIAAVALLAVVVRRRS